MYGKNYNVKKIICVIEDCRHYLYSPTQIVRTSAICIVTLNARLHNTRACVNICNQAKSADNDNHCATLPCAKQLRNSKSIQSHEQTQHSIKK